MNLIFYKNSLLGFFLLFSYAVFGQIMIDKEVIEHPTCHDSLDGKIALKIKGGVLPYSFLWSNGVTLDSIEDVKHGVYQVTITDNATPKNKLIKSFTLSNPAPMEFFYHFECSTVFKDKSNHTLWFDSIKNVKLFTIYENTSFVQTPNILTYTWEDMMPPNTGIIVPAYDFGNYYVHIKIVDESKKYSKQGGMYRETCRAKFLITPPKEIKEMISASIDSPDTLFIQKGKTLKETLKSNYFTTTTRKSSLTHEWRRYEGTKIEKYKYKNLDCDFCMSIDIEEKEEAVYQLYFQTGTSSGCFVTDEVYIIDKDKITIDTITLKEPPSIAYLPTIFSPNDDGINDQLTIYGANGVEKVISMRVFDQWGNLIFEQKDFPPSDNHYGWDGTYKGIPANQGIYTCSYVLLLTDGKEKILNNAVQLSR